MRVVNSLHFRVERDGEIVAAHFDAFVYTWRMWSVPELRDAMLEAGFATTRITDGITVESELAGDSPANAAAEHHIVCVCGRV
jgi:hypothetical protein